MFQNSGRFAATLGSVGILGIALVGCTENPDVQGNQSGIALRSAIGNTCVNDGETLTFDITVWADADADGIADDPANPDIAYTGLDLTQVFDVGDLDLGTDGSGDGLTGIWVGGDQFFLLPPGNYIATATAVGTTVPLLPSASQTNTGIVVPLGGTAETVFAFQCEGQTISALDVVVLVTEGPSIVGWDYDEDKFGMLCEDVGMTATFTDLQGGPMTVTYEMFPTAIPGYSGPGQNGTPFASYTTNVTAPAGGVPFSTTWNYPHPGPAGTYYVYVSITNSAVPPQTTTFQALFHAYDAVGGYCYDGVMQTATLWDTGAVPFLQGLEYHNSSGLSFPVRGADLIIESADLTTGIDAAVFGINSPRIGADGTTEVEGTVTLAYGATAPFNQAIYDVDMIELTPAFQAITTPVVGYKYMGSLGFKILSQTDGSLVGYGDFKGPAFIADVGVPGGWKMVYGRSDWTITGAGGELASGPSGGKNINADDMIPAPYTYTAYGLNSCDGPVILDEACAANLVGIQPCDEVCSPWPPAI